MIALFTVYFCFNSLNTAHAPYSLLLNFNFNLIVFYVFYCINVFYFMYLFYAPSMCVIYVCVYIFKCYWMPKIPLWGLIKYLSVCLSICLSITTHMRQHPVKEYR